MRVDPLPPEDQRKKARECFGKLFLEATLAQLNDDVKYGRKPKVERLEDALLWAHTGARDPPLTAKEKVAARWGHATSCAAHQEQSAQPLEEILEMAPKFLAICQLCNVLSYWKSLPHKGCTF